MPRNRNKRRIDRMPNDREDGHQGAASFPATGRLRRPGILWLGLFLMLVAAAGIFRGKAAALWSAAGSMVKHSAGITTSAVSEASAALNQAALEPPTLLPTVRHRFPKEENAPPHTVVEKSPPALKELYLVQVGDQLRVAASFSHMPGYRLFRQERGRRLVLELPEGTTVPSLPEGATPPMLKKFTCESIGGRVHLVFCFDRPCRWVEQGIRNNPDNDDRTLVFAVRPEPKAAVPAAAPRNSSPVEATDTAPVASADTGQAPVRAPAPKTRKFIRQDVRTTDRQRADDLYEEAIAAFQKGRSDRAEQALRAALTVCPGHIGARSALLNLLIRLNRHGQVKALLAQGVRLAPEHLPYRIRLVRLLIDEDELAQARAELTRTPLPPVAEAPDLYAMSATVSLRQGRYQDAAQTYRDLLKVRPKQAVWWMGLGIALEGHAAFDRARRAYDQALRHDGLSDNLRTFIRRRLAASGKEQAGNPLAHRNSEEDRS